MTLGTLYGNRAFAATVRTRILSQRSAFAVTIFGGGEHAKRVILGHQHRKYLLPRLEIHPADPTCSAPHWTYILFGKARSLAIIRKEQDVVLARSELSTDEVIILG